MSLLYTLLATTDPTSLPLKTMWSSKSPPPRKMRSLIAKVLFLMRNFVLRTYKGMSSGIDFWLQFALSIIVHSIFEFLHKNVTWCNSPGKKTTVSDWPQRYRTDVSATGPVSLEYNLQRFLRACLFIEKNPVIVRTTPVNQSFHKANPLWTLLISVRK